MTATTNVKMKNNWINKRWIRITITRTGQRWRRRWMRHWRGPTASKWDRAVRDPTCVAPVCRSFHHRWNNNNSRTTQQQAWWRRWRLQRTKAVQDGKANEATAAAVTAKTRRTASEMTAAEATAAAAATATATVAKQIGERERCSQWRVETMEMAGTSFFFTFFYLWRRWLEVFWCSADWLRVWRTARGQKERKKKELNN